MAETNISKEIRLQAGRNKADGTSATSSREQRNRGKNQPRTHGQQDLDQEQLLFGVKYMDDPNSLYALYPELMAGRYEKAIKNDEKEVDLLRPNSLDKEIVKNTTTNSTNSQEKPLDQSIIIDPEKDLFVRECGNSSVEDDFVDIFEESRKMEEVANKLPKKKAQSRKKRWYFCCLF